MTYPFVPIPPGRDTAENDGQGVPVGTVQVVRDRTGYQAVTTPGWAGLTPYAAGQQVLTPNGLQTSNAARTSRANFDPTEATFWTLVSGGGWLPSSSSAAANKGLLQWGTGYGGTEGEVLMLIDKTDGTYRAQFKTITGTLSLQGPGDNSVNPGSPQLYLELIGPRPFLEFYGTDAGALPYSVGVVGPNFYIAAGNPGLGINPVFQYNATAATVNSQGGITWRWFSDAGVTLKASINGANGDGVFNTLTLGSASGRINAANGLLILDAAAASGIYLGETADTGQIILRRDVAFEAGHKAGFFGTAPIVKPTGTPAAATDLATVIALANSLRTNLLALGLVG